MKSLRIKRRPNNRLVADDFDDLSDRDWFFAVGYEKHGRSFFQTGYLGRALEVDNEGKNYKIWSHLSDASHLFTSVSIDPEPLNFHGFVVPVFHFLEDCLTREENNLVRFYSNSEGPLHLFAEIYDKVPDFAPSVGQLLKI
jgi:hypothetical protein